MRRVVGGDCGRGRERRHEPRSRPRSRARSASTIRRSTWSRSSASIMPARKRRAARAGAELGQHTGDALGLQAGKLHRQRLARWADMKEPLAAVAGALALHHIALVDKLLEHAAERLLGDLQDIEKVGNLDAGIAVDEMQHAMVGG